jgi:hypothetical protein
METRDVGQRINDQPLQTPEYAAQALQMMGYDPLSARGLAEEWFPLSDITNDARAEEEAANQLQYGDPRGPEGLLHDQLAGQNDEQDFMLTQAEQVSGLPRQVFSAAATDLLMPIEEVVATVTSEAWADVNAKAREFADADDVDGYVAWLDENADPATKAIAVSIYDPLFG